MSENIDQQKLYRVGEPELPNVEDYKSCISHMWKHKTLSNFGPYTNEFENLLKEYFKMEGVVLFSNGTSALEALISVMGLRNEILTSAFSFVATLTAITRNQICPSFVDVGIEDGNMQPKDILPKINAETSALLGVHAYGFAADVLSIQDIGKQAELPVIFDAAHAMGSMYNDEHLVRYGDASVISFHATKILNSIEGGAAVTEDKYLAQELARFRNFGYNCDKSFSNGFGTNSKMSEVHAAAGVLQLNNFQSTLKKRQDLFFEYENRLTAIDYVQLFHPRDGSVVNGSYMPILLESSQQRKNLMLALENENIFTKPYFDTNLSNYYGSKRTNLDLPVTEELTKRVLCLPIHSSMSETDVHFVCNKIASYEAQRI